MSKDTLKTADSFDKELDKILGTEWMNEPLRQKTKQAIKLAIETHIITPQDKKEYWPVWKKELIERQRQALFNGEGKSE